MFVEPFLKSSPAIRRYADNPLLAGKDIPYVIDPRRPGDIPECYADCSKAYEELGWKAEKTLDDMCADSLRWQRMNPNGFED